MTAASLIRFTRKHPRAILDPQFWLIRPVAFILKRKYGTRIISNAVLRHLGYHSHLVD